MTGADAPATAVSDPRLVRGRCEGGPLDGKTIDAPPNWLGLFTTKWSAGRYLLGQDGDGRPVWRWRDGPVVGTGRSADPSSPTTTTTERV